MSGSVTKLSSGDQIQIRDGVLQGIGPQGPTGPTGPQGDDGKTGPQGIPGPMGQVVEHYAYAHNTGNPQSAATASDTLLSFPTVVRDDPGVMSSLTNILLPIGLWMVKVTCNFQKPSSANASGWRKLWITYDGSSNIIETESRNAIPDIDTEFSTTAMVKAVSAGKIVQLTIRHSDTVSLSLLCHVTVSRFGPGQAGDDGPQGPAGPPGGVGATGPQGPAGSLITNTTTFASIGG